MLKSFKIYTCTNGALGLHLSRAPWDPYPWVSSIQKDSTSFAAGLRMGDCLLELNGQDVLGMKISEIAALLKNHWLNESSNYVTVVIWRNKSNTGMEGVDGDAAAVMDDEDEENNAHNINQQSLQKFATCLQHIAQLLECPVCLEVIKPPGWQCCNGHVLCNNCRSRSEKCPVCRVPLGPRGRCLLSDKLFTLLADSFPCDGVRSNKNSPKDRRKCSTEFHNQPKMAILQKQQHHQQQHKDEAEIKAKDFKKIQQDFILTTSLRRRARKTSWYKMHEAKIDQEEQAVEQEQRVIQEENKHTAHHPSMDQAMHDTNVVVKIKGNRRNSMSSNSNNDRKSSQDYCDVVASTLRQPGFSSNASNVKGVAVTTMAASFCNDELLLGQTSTIQQCHCITCYKPDKVAIVNNVTTTAATTITTTATTFNKYILQVPSEQQPDIEGQENIVQQQQKEKYQNYQCPTGKLCCLKKNVMPGAILTSGPHTTSTNPSTPTITNNNLSTKQTTNAESATQSSNIAALGHCEGLLQHDEDEFNNFHKTLKNEWEILAHLTEDHHLPVNQYYAEYGQRIQVPCDRQQKSLTCLNLKGANSAKVEKFFIACIPLEIAKESSTNSSKVAIFIYHMNTLTNSTSTTTTSTATDTLTSTTTSSAISKTDEVSNFETIIENPQTGIKWFGRAHCLTTPWSRIYHKQHFLMHDVMENVVVDDDNGASVVGGSTGGSSTDAFVFVIKTKL